MTVGDSGDEEVDRRQAVVPTRASWRCASSARCSTSWSTGSGGGRRGRPAARRARARRGRSTRPRAGTAGRRDPARLDQCGDSAARDRGAAASRAHAELSISSVTDGPSRSGGPRRRPRGRRARRPAGSARPASRRRFVTSTRSARRCAVFSRAPRITSSPSSTRSPELMAQLVERLANGLGLGDRMSRPLRRDALQCNTGVTPHN